MCKMHDVMDLHAYIHLILCRIRTEAVYVYMDVRSRNPSMRLLKILSFFSSFDHLTLICLVCM